ncbi:MAG: hypothetical protein BWY22_02348 [Bacteroidetes bacterium ADurb.Bin217]|nr:MAG: hypothetical protein BWY22_02348 [Bacteroidetes bacterium ADurb.Bin217]
MNESANCDVFSNVIDCPLQIAVFDAVKLDIGCGCTFIVCITESLHPNSVVTICLTS